MITMAAVIAAATLSGVTVDGSRNADYNLVSRNTLPDGTIGECRRITEDRAGWNPFECRTGPFLGRDSFSPIAAEHTSADAWLSSPASVFSGPARARANLIRILAHGND